MARPLPHPARPGAKLPLQAARDNLVRIHRDYEADYQALPTHRDDDRVWLTVIEFVKKRFVKIRRRDLDGDTQSAFGRIVGETASAWEMSDNDRGFDLVVSRFPDTQGKGDNPYLTIAIRRR
jgi:hypothetical protein